MSITLKKALTLTGLLIIALISIFIPWVAVEAGENEFIELGHIVLFGHGFNGLAFLLIICWVLLILSIVFTVYKEKCKAFLPLAIVFSITAGALFICVPNFYGFIAGLEDIEATINVGPVILAIESFLMTISAFMLMDKNSSFKNMSVYEMVEMSVFVALAVVLDLFAKIDINAGAGSIGFAMFPLMIIALRHGPVKGFIASGIVFGFVTCLTDGYGMMYFPFDYLLGFGSVGLLGLFKNLILPNGEYPIKGSKGAQFGYGILFMVLGVTCIFVGRTLASSLSSMVFYGYTFVEALAYQMTYVPGSCGVCLAILILLYKPLLIINEKYALKHLQQDQNNKTEE